MILPIRDNILIVAIRGQDTWYGSSLIVRPESTKDRTNQGYVKAIGPDVQDVSVGEFVMFNPYSGTLLNDSAEGDKQIMISEKGVIGKLFPPNTTVPGLFVETTEGTIPATIESAMLLCREAFETFVGEYAVQKEKFEQRFGA